MFPTFLPSLIALFIAYRLISPSYTSRKQLSWVLTAVSSAVMTLASIPFVWDYAASGGSVKSVPTLAPLAVAANRFFQAYLTADMLIGAVYYRDQVALLTGWVHHVVYILIVEMALRRSWAHIFCLCASMELPTFILAFTILNPHLRSNVLFAISFFLTRIMLHIALCISYLLPQNRAHTTGGSFLPCTVLTAVFPLHAMWFHGCIKGFIKRARMATVEGVDGSMSPPPAFVTHTHSDSDTLSTIPQPPVPSDTATCHSTTTTTTTITVPGSFSLPAVRLRLSVHHASIKRGFRNMTRHKSVSNAG